MRLLILSTALMLCFPASAANVLLHNATIYTVNEDQPRVEALVFSEAGEILAAGEAAALREQYPNARSLDAGGHTVIPGMIDAHAHLMDLGTILLRADLTGTGSKQQIIERLKAFADNLPAGEWLQGRGWDQNDWPEKTFPTRADLDAAFPARPVWLERVDGHAGWANTAALKAAGLLAGEREAPAGGKILRGADGGFSGVFVDKAMSLVEAAIPEPSPSFYRRALRAALDTTARFGLTGVHEAGVTLEHFKRYQQAIDFGAFPVRLYAMASGQGDLFEKLCADGPILRYGDRLIARSVKYYMDGALGSRGAALLEDYSDDPDNRGLLRHEPEAFTAMVVEAMECGLQVNTHAIGDRANRVVMDAYEKAIEKTGGGPGRHRIEHVQILALEDIPRFAKLDVIASMQPTHATSDMPWAQDRLGAGRLKGAYAWQRLLDTGARLALGSDFPVEQVNPLLGFYAAVTRQDAQGTPQGGWFPDQRLSREQALKGFTLGAAYAAFMEDQVGSLEPGKRADFVILSNDIMQVPPAGILDTRVIATYLDGRPVYRAP